MRSDAITFDVAGASQMKEKILVPDAQGKASFVAKAEGVSLRVQNALNKDDYKPLSFDKPIRHEGLARSVIAEWLNYYTDRNWSPAKWQKEKRFLLPYTKEDYATAIIEIDIEKATSLIQRHKCFPHEELGIPVNLKIPWLDRSGCASLDALWAPYPDNPLQTDILEIRCTLSESFPLRPAIDREGLLYAPLTTFLHKSIVKSREYLVEYSHQMFTFDENWMQNFFTYFNSCISLVDSICMHVRYMAKYDSMEPKRETSLIYDEKALGPIMARRLIDKIRWIALCTGSQLDNISSELRSLKRIKAVRNHINHFDPPVFSCTAEEVCSWLNDIYDIGNLLWKIRQKLRLPPSRALCAILSVPRVTFVPSVSGQIRPPQKVTSGYATSCWPEAQASDSNDSMDSADERRCQGAAESLLTVLAARKFAISPQQRAYAMQCRNFARLQQWLVNAVSVRSIDKVFSP